MKIITTIIRLCLTAYILSIAYTETGWATVLCLSLIVIKFELETFQNYRSLSYSHLEMASKILRAGRER